MLIFHRSGGSENTIYIRDENLINLVNLKITSICLWIPKIIPNFKMLNKLMNMFDDKKVFYI